MAERRIDRDADKGGRLAASARGRLAAAAADLGLPESRRLTEWQRRSAALLLARLVRAIEDGLRADLAQKFSGHDALHAALASPKVEIALPLLGASAWEPALIALLLRRVDEQRLRRGSGDSGLLTELAANADEMVAAAAMAVLVAEGGRLDSFGEPLLPPAELPAERAHHLAWTIAAALRSYALREHGLDAASADAALAAAVAGLLAGHDEGEGFAASVLRLVRALDRAGLLDDSMAVRMAAEGHLPLLLAAFDLRAEIGAEAGWELLSDPAGEGAMLLLRAAGLGRDAAGAILLRLHGESETTFAAFERFESLGRDQAAALLGLWRADPAYRAAVARMAA
jgi:hypothetical protein